MNIDYLAGVVIKKKKEKKVKKIEKNKEISETVVVPLLNRFSVFVIENHPSLVRCYEVEFKNCCCFTIFFFWGGK